MNAPKLPKRSNSGTSSSRSPTKRAASLTTSNKETTPASHPLTKQKSRSPSPPVSQKITVNSVMEDVQESKVIVAASCKVYELKNSICQATDVLAEKQLLIYKSKELKDDSAPISKYGITEDCEIMMHVRMNTGSKTVKASNAVLYVPPSFPEGSVDELRSKIKSLTNIRGGTKHRIYKKKQGGSKVDKKHTEWTPQKQFEHELTRNKMKKLLKRKRKKILSYSPPCPSTGSIRSSAENIPRNLSKESLEKPSFEKKSDPYTVTELQLKTFFEPPETLAQMEREMKDLTLPPSNMEELIAVKTKREETLKTTCGVCRRKLHVTEQQMACACSYTFCKKHREPDKHFCNIDHRHAGRSKIHKENPKVSGGGLHKARTPSKG
ncbi:hypothetical protein RB195_001634 [Necator americanus]|uniref:AN1-like Zinc finger n=1 Tax=Necator americanus TaxID=51031 RepID=A0ABR1DF96_NECAM